MLADSQGNAETIGDLLLGARLLGNQVGDRIDGLGVTGF
jgi:hypothetical protein